MQYRNTQAVVLSPTNNNKKRRLNHEISKIHAPSHHRSETNATSSSFSGWRSRI